MADVGPRATCLTAVTVPESVPFMGNAQVCCPPVESFEESGEAVIIAEGTEWQGRGVELPGAHRAESGLSVL